MNDRVHTTIFFLFFFFLFFPFGLKSQTHEFGIVAGPTGYSGDLAPFGGSLFKVGGKANDKLLGFDNLGINAFYKYNFNERNSSFFVKNAGIRINLWYSSQSGGAVDRAERYSDPRGLQFFTHVFELSGVYELDFFKFSVSKQHFSLYAFGGLGVMNYDPKAYFPNDTGEGSLNPLKLYVTEEGDADENGHRVQRTGTWSYALPFGGGIKWKPGNKRNPWTFGIELSARITTDNLDDVHGVYPSFVDDEAHDTPDYITNFLADPSRSYHAGQPRGNQYLFDMYKMLGIRVSYTLFSCDCPSW